MTHCLHEIADGFRYRLTLAVLTIVGILFVASLAAHYCVEIAREKLKGQNQ